MKPVNLFPKLENEKLGKSPLLDTNEENTQLKLLLIIFNIMGGASTRLKLILWNYEKNKKTERN